MAFCSSGLPNVTEVRETLYKIQKTLECPICLELLSDPYTPQCSHPFCRTCIYKVISANKQAKCPLCKLTITKRSLNENARLGEIVEAVKELEQAIINDTGTKSTPPQVINHSHEATGTPGMIIHSLVHPTPIKPHPSEEYCDDILPIPTSRVNQADTTTNNSLVPNESFAGPSTSASSDQLLTSDTIEPQDSGPAGKGPVIKRRRKVRFKSSRGRKKSAKGVCVDSQHTRDLLEALQEGALREPGNSSNLAQNTTGTSIAHQDTAMVSNPPQDATTISNPPQDTTTVSNPPQDTTTASNPPQDTTMISNPPQDTTTVSNPPQDATMVSKDTSNLCQDTSKLEREKSSDTHASQHQIVDSAKSSKDYSNQSATVSTCSDHKGVTNQTIEEPSSSNVVECPVSTVAETPYLRAVEVLSMPSLQFVKETPLMTVGERESIGETPLICLNGLRDAANTCHVSVWTNANNHIQDNTADFSNHSQKNNSIVSNLPKDTAQIDAADTVVLAQETQLLSPPFDSMDPLILAPTQQLTVIEDTQPTLTTTLHETENTVCANKPFVQPPFSSPIKTTLSSSTSVVYSVQNQTMESLSVPQAGPVNIQNGGSITGSHDDCISPVIPLQNSYGSVSVPSGLKECGKTDAQFSVDSSQASPNRLTNVALPGLNRHSHSKTVGPEVFSEGKIEQSTNISATGSNVSSDHSIYSNTLSSSSTDHTTTQNNSNSPTSTTSSNSTFSTSPFAMTPHTLVNLLSPEMSTQELDALRQQMIEKEREVRELEALLLQGRLVTETSQTGSVGVTQTIETQSVIQSSQAGSVSVTQTSQMESIGTNQTGSVGVAQAGLTPIHVISSGETESTQAKSHSDQTCEHSPPSIDTSTGWSTAALGANMNTQSSKSTVDSPQVILETQFTGHPETVIATEHVQCDTITEFAKATSAGIETATERVQMESTVSDTTNERGSPKPCVNEETEKEGVDVDLTSEGVRGQAMKRGRSPTDSPESAAKEPSPKRTRLVDNHAVSEEAPGGGDETCTIEFNSDDFEAYSLLSPNAPLADDHPFMSVSTVKPSADFVPHRATGSMFNPSHTSSHLNPNNYQFNNRNDRFNPSHTVQDDQTTSLTSTEFKQPSTSEPQQTVFESSETSKSAQTDHTSKTPKDNVKSSNVVPKTDAALNFPDPPSTLQKNVCTRLEPATSFSTPKQQNTRVVQTPSLSGVFHSPGGGKRQTLSLVGSGLTKLQLRQAQQFARKHGGRIASVFNCHTTHVVVSADYNGLCPRTVKYLQGVLAGVWVLSFKWVEESLKANSLLPEGPYEVKGDNTLADNSLCIPAMARLSVTRQEPGLFSSRLFYLHCDLGGISKDQLSQLLCLGGGEVVESVRTDAVTVCDCVGGVDHPPCVVVSSSCVLDCISRYTALSLANS